MKKIEQAKMNAKDMLDRVIPICQEQINNNFDLDEYTKERLTSFFNRTSETVLKLSLTKYQAKLLKQEEKNDYGNFTTQTLAITKPQFTKKERLYLLSLYINKMIEYDFESLGLTSIDIIKRYTAPCDIEKSKIYNTKDKDNGPDSCYDLKLGFSPMKIYIKDNCHNNKIKIYHSMIEEVN